MAVAHINGVDLFYEDLGSGEPVLVIHGAAASGRWFGELPSRLAQSCRVIMPDLRGLGRSQRVAALDSYRTWVDDQWALLDYLGLETVHVIGCSLGSRIGARMSLERPERLRSLTVDAPIIGISTSGNSSLNSVFTVVDEGSDQAREWEMLHGSDWRDVVAFYARARGTSGLQEFLTVRQELGQISVPTLICRGDHDDPVHPLEDSFIWHKATPRSELLVFPGATQSSVMLEGPDLFLQAFSAFMDRLKSTQQA